MYITYFIAYIKYMNCCTPMCSLNLLFDKLLLTNFLLAKQEALQCCVVLWENSDLFNFLFFSQVFLILCLFSHPTVVK